MIVFDGNRVASQKEQALALVVKGLERRVHIVAVLFREDQGSALYTSLKKATAERLGITYDVLTFSLRDDVETVIAEIQAANQNPQVTGIIVQKPWRRTWEEVVGGSSDDKGSFVKWWQQLTAAIAPTKDVDGLHPSTHDFITLGTWQAQGRVLPATCRAVLSILEENNLMSPTLKYSIIGRSDLVGQPLLQVLRHSGYQVELLGRAELAQKVADGEGLLKTDVVISATGHKGIITGDMVKSGVAIIDVGEPKGDVDRISVDGKPGFITPVPGGVGPLTVICLMENAVELAQK